MKKKDMKHYFLLFGEALTCCVLQACCVKAPTQYTIPADSYAIVASSAIMHDVEWRAATVETLQQKYPTAQLYVWSKDLKEIQQDLTKQQPSFTFFVVRPEEAGAELTIDISTLCRALDDDPYTDTFWGVITGYNAISAQAIANADSITIERALDCAGCDLEVFREAWRYSEDHRGIMKIWKRGVTTSIQDIPCDTDNTAGMLERLQDDRIQFLTTSGHATQHDWQMGYCGPNMTMVHKNGQLFAKDTKKRLHRAASPEPKVYFATGNCLIGDIDQVDCMALSWMRDGGVKQFMGYTVTTWYGAQGWGTQGLFVDTAGLCTAAEAFHFTNIGIVNWLEKQPIQDLRAFRLEKLQRVNLPTTPGMNHYAEQLQKEGRAPQQIQKLIRDITGHLHDRDTVCFYGDPALQTRIADGRFVIHSSVLDGDTLILSMTPQATAKDGVVWFRLPGSWTYDIASISTSPELGKPDLMLDNVLRFPQAKVSSATGKTLWVKLPMAVRKGENH